jgi:hypothetical protein
VSTGNSVVTTIGLTAITDVLVYSFATLVATDEGDDDFWDDDDVAQTNQPIPTDYSFHVGSGCDPRAILKGYAGEHIESLRNFLKPYFPRASIAVDGEIGMMGPLYSKDGSQFGMTLWDMLRFSYLGARGSINCTYHAHGECAMFAGRASSWHSLDKMYNFGCEIADSRVNPVLSVNQPYYSNKRFAYVAGNESDDIQRRFLVVIPASTGPFMVYEWISVGEDFNFVHFQHFPQFTPASVI